jgi:mono/diheme cytochrome c family protein
MKKRFLRLLFLSSILLSLLTACEYDYIVPTPPIPPPPANDTVSYSQDIQPFYNAKCISCHGGSTAPNLTAGQSYAATVPAFVVAGSPETSEMYIVCKTGGSMTAYATITAAELDLLYRWIFAGAKND